MRNLPQHDWLYYGICFFTGICLARMVIGFVIKVYFDF